MLAASRIVSPAITPSIALGDATPISTNAITIGFQATRSPGS
jgi:hypothetical protein